jgi:hypothetical protein
VRAVRTLPQRRFVHSTPSREAAFALLTHPSIFALVNPHLRRLSPFPLGSAALSDGFTPKGRNSICSLGTTCYITALMRSLNPLTPFVEQVLTQPSESLADRHLLREFCNFFAPLTFSRGACFSFKNFAR